MNRYKLPIGLFVLGIILAITYKLEWRATFDIVIALFFLSAGSFVLSIITATLIFIKQKSVNSISIYKWILAASAVGFIALIVLDWYASANRIGCNGYCDFAFWVTDGPLYLFFQFGPPILLLLAISSGLFLAMSKNHQQHAYSN